MLGKIEHAEKRDASPPAHFEHNQVCIKLLMKLIFGSVEIIQEGSPIVF